MLVPILGLILGYLYYANIDAFWICIALLFNPYTLALIIGFIILNSFFARSIYYKDYPGYY